MVHIHIDSSHMCMLFKYRAFRFDSDAVHSCLHLIRFTHCAQAAMHTQYRRGTMTIHRADERRHSVKNTGFMLCGSSPHSRLERFIFHPRPPPPAPYKPIHSNTCMTSLGSVQPCCNYRMLYWISFRCVAITVSRIFVLRYPKPAIYILVYAASESRQFSVN